jgi:hypothetical protein
MSRGRSFLQLYTDLRAELGRATDPAVGVSDIDTLKQTLRRNYETLWDDVDWPFLNADFVPITLQAGQRYYDPPTQVSDGTTTTVTSGVELDMIQTITCIYSGLPHPLTKGVGDEHYALFDSRTGVRSDPALRWDVKFTGVREQIEIWPIPSSNDMTLAIKGRMKCGNLAADTDIVMLDDKLLLLFAAAQILQRQGSKDAKTFENLANRRYYKLTGRWKSKDDGYRIGMTNKTNPDRYRAIVRVR